MYLRDKVFTKEKSCMNIWCVFLVILRSYLLNKNCGLSTSKCVSVGFLCVAANCSWLVDYIWWTIVTILSGWRPTALSAIVYYLFGGVSCGRFSWLFLVIHKISNIWSFIANCWNHTIYLPLWLHGWDFSLQKLVPVCLELLFYF